MDNQEGEGMRSTRFLDRVIVEPVTAMTTGQSLQGLGHLLAGERERRLQRQPLATPLGKGSLIFVPLSGL